MRQLFVPACLCLMTLSSSIGDEPKTSIEQFGTVQKREQTAALSNLAELTEALPPVTDIVDMRYEVVTQDSAALFASIDRSVVTTRSDTVSVESARALTPIEAVPLPKSKPEIKPVIYRSKEEVCDTLTRAAQNNGLPVPFFISLLFQESRFSPGVVSNAGAQGIAQFMPETASDMGLDNPFDPLQAIPASAQLLRNLFERFGNLGLAAAAYNAGPKRIQDWLAKKGSLPEETQGYVKTITGRPAENWKASENGAPAVKLPRHAPCQEAAGLLAWNGPDEIPTPAVAPHRRAKEPIAVAVARPPANPGQSKAEKTVQAKTEVKVARRSDRPAAVIKVADASGGLPRTAASSAKAEADAPKKNAVRKKSDNKQVAKADPNRKAATKNKDTKKDGKGALQLAARKQNKKVRVSQR